MNNRSRRTSCCWLLRGKLRTGVCRRRYGEMNRGQAGGAHPALRQIPPCDFDRWKGEVSFLLNEELLRLDPLTVNELPARRLEVSDLRLIRVSPKTIGHGRDDRRYKHSLQPERGDRDGASDSVACVEVFERRFPGLLHLELSCGNEIRELARGSRDDGCKFQRRNGNFGERRRRRLLCIRNGNSCGWKLKLSGRFRVNGIELADTCIRDAGDLFVDVLRRVLGKDNQGIV